MSDASLIPAVELKSRVIGTEIVTAEFATPTNTRLALAGIPPFALKDPDIVMLRSLAGLAPPSMSPDTRNELPTRYPDPG